MTDTTKQVNTGGGPGHTPVEPAAQELPVVSVSLAAPLPETAAVPVLDPLVVRCQQGDQAAFRELFQKYHGWVQGTVYHMVPTPADLDDVVQNVFLEVFRSIHRFEGRSRFSTWLTRLAINVALGHRRKWRFWKRTEETVQDDARHGTSVVEQLRPPMPDDLLTERRNRARVRLLVQQLSPKKRAVFVMSEIQGMQAPEIAEVLSIPPATVRTRLFHARREFEMMVREDAVLGPQVASRGGGDGGA
ncbi:MAG: sigma-70 family RNA polymerase sigma factor [Deltaproteobacteria bacterium]|nr:sigma-70 family RNA polymerase sigma factor [Deltaproteobacteria bacterium]